MLSWIVNPLSKFVPDTWLNPSGKNGLVILLVIVNAPPFASSPGCFGSAVMLTPIFDVKSSFVSSIGVFSNLIVTINVVSS